MAEPGLLAVRRDGREDLFRAQWGGDDAVLATAFAGPKRLYAAADWRPTRRAVRRCEWVDGLDHLRTSAVYVVSRYGVRAYLSLWFGLPTAGLVAEPGAGVLARGYSLPDARRLRRRWRELKGALAEAVEAGSLPVAAVPVVLGSALAGRATLDCPGGDGDPRACGLL